MSYTLFRAKQDKPYNFYSTEKEYGEGNALAISKCAEEAIANHRGNSIPRVNTPIESDVGAIKNLEVFGMGWSNYGGGIRIFYNDNGKAVDINYSKRTKSS